MLPLDHVEAPIIRDLSLPRNPTVVVVGAYKGTTVRFISHHFPRAKIYAFEPQRFAYEELVKDRGKNIKCYNYALGILNAGKARLYESDTDAASLLPLPDARTSTLVEVRDAREVFVMLGIRDIHFMLVNIEGYEYYLVPYLVDAPNLAVRKLLVQFHFKDRFDKKWTQTRQLLIDLGYKDIFIGRGWELWQI